MFGKFLSRAHFLIAVVLSCAFCASCTFPERTGYSRKIGDYKPIAKHSKATKQEIKPETKKTVSAADKPASKKSAAPEKKQAPATPSKKYSSLREYTDSWTGVKYVYGGASRSGTDCSGYIMNIYRDVYGVNLPHKASMIYEDQRFTKVSRSDLKEGDLVFFGDFWGISHIGISLGGETFSHASTSRGVTQDNLSAKYYDSRYKGARRLKK